MLSYDLGSSVETSYIVRVHTGGRKTEKGGKGVKGGGGGGPKSDDSTETLEHFVLYSLLSN